MLSQLLDSGRTLTYEALVARDTVVTWRALGEQVDRCEDRLSALGHRRVALAFSPTWQAFAALFALDRLGCDVVLMSDQVTVEDAASLGGPLNLEALVAAADGADEPILVHHWPRTAAASGRRAVTILTSGTSGQPKPVRHTWQTLARAARSAPPQRWLLTYRPNLYAGLQVILQCLMNKGTLVLPASGMSAHEVVALMAAAKVEYASATPSYWRWLVTMAESAVMQRVPLKQITLGGEVVQQPILDRLKQQFPDARIVHVYATTELGRCFSVTDGRAGFPVRFLEQPSSDGIEMKIADGELIVRSANRMEGYENAAGPAPDWIATGDLVKVIDDRVSFIGRRSDLINVGGNKVHPLEVELVIAGVAGVSDVLVFAKRSSIAGELVACEVELEAGADPEATVHAIRAACVDGLAAYQRPFAVKVVHDIELTSAGKKRRV